MSTAQRASMCKCSRLGLPGCLPLKHRCVAGLQACSSQRKPSEASAVSVPHHNYGSVSSGSSQQRCNCLPETSTVGPSGRDISGREGPKSASQHRHTQGKRHHRRFRAQYITQAISKASTIAALQGLVQQESASLNHIHISTLLAKLSQFADQDPVEWYQPAAGYPKAPSRGPSGVPSSSRAQQQRQPLLGSDDEPGPSGRSTRPWSRRQAEAAGQQIWTLAKRAAQLAAQQARDFDSTSMSITLSSLAKLGYHDRRVMDKLLPASESLLPSCSPLALSNMVWACATLKQQVPPSWLHAAADAAQDQFASMNSRELSTVVVCLSRLGCRPGEQWLETCCQCSQQHLQQCRPADLPNLVAGLSTMGYQPSNAWLEQYMEATQEHMHEFSSKNLVLMVQSMAAINAQPNAAWLADFYQACKRVAAHEPGISAPQLSTVVVALAQMGCRPDGAWLDEFLLRSRRSLKSASATELVQLVGGLSTMGFRAGEVWFQHFLTASFQQLAFLSPEQSCRMLLALARLGQQPKGMWLEEFSNKVQGKFPQFSGEQLGSIMVGLASQGYHPTERWLAEFESASQGKLRACSSDSLAGIVWALAQIGYQPQVSWLYSYVLAAYGKLDSFDAGQLGMVFEALPKVSPHPMWLDELVQICASETTLKSRSSMDSMDDIDDFIVPDASSGATQRQNGTSVWQPLYAAKASRNGSSNGSSSGTSMQTSSSILLQGDLGGSSVAVAAEAPVSAARSGNGLVPMVINGTDVLPTRLAAGVAGAASASASVAAVNGMVPCGVKIINSSGGGGTRSNGSSNGNTVRYGVDMANGSDVDGNGCTTIYSLQDAPMAFEASNVHGTVPVLG